VESHRGHLLRSGGPLERGVTHGDDLALSDGHVAGKGFPAASVDYLSMPHQQIECHASSHPVEGVILTM
jgi:hypothetical protein